MVNAVDPPAFLDTVQGELAFFKGVAHARPAGAHRFFHVISIRSTIRAETGQEVSIDELWSKLGNYYDLHYFDSNEVDPNDVENESQDPDIAAPSLNSYTSAASDSEIVEADEPPRKKQRQNPTDEFFASSPLSSAADHKNGIDHGDHPKEGKALNYHVHPHFRSEFVLPVQEFHALMRQRALRTDDVVSSRGNSPELELVELLYAPATKATGRKGRPSRKAQQAAKAEGSIIADALDGYSDTSAPAPLATAGNEEDGERTGSPTRSKGGAVRRSRTRSVSMAAKPKQQIPSFGGADSDSSLSEPDEGGEEGPRAEGEEQYEEAAESIFSIPTPAEHTEDEAPSVQGRSTTRSKRKEREPTVESLASATRSATSKRTAAATSARVKKAAAKKKK